MASKRFVESGEVFGSLTVVKEVAPHIRSNGKKERKFLCKCNCGKSIEVTLQKLVSGHTKSCGCLRADRSIPRKSPVVLSNDELIGKVFGRLTIKSIAPSRPKHRKVVCQCTCGSEKEFLLLNLLNGYTKSCGCLSKELTIERSKCENTYEVIGGVTKVFDNDGNFSLIDTADLDKVRNYYFYLNSRGYWQSGKVLLHRLVTDCPDEKVVDHINHKRYDNRRSNLYLCDIATNTRNFPTIGTTYLKQHRVWVASVLINDEIVYLPDNFATKELADDARISFISECKEQFPNSIII